MQPIAGLAERLGLDVMQTAQGIVSVVTANMARAIRVISVQRGYDPRDYTLVAFGGAGPLHAARLARELEIGRVLVPVSPGILCAMGLLLTDLRTDFALTRLTPLDDAAGRCCRRRFATLTARAEAWFDAEGIARRTPTHRPHRRHALCRPELRAADSACPTATARWPAQAGALADGLRCRAPAPVRFRRRTTNPCSSSRSVWKHPRSCRRRRSRRSRIAGPDASARHHRPPPGLAAGGRRLRRLPDLRPGRAARRQPLHRPGGDRADGRHHHRPAGHDRPRRTLPQPDPGGGMIDPITVEVIGSALSSIVEEMGEALIRASYSTNIKERRDCSTALFDLDGKTLCQAEHIPMHLGSFLDLIPHIMKRHPIARDAARRRVLRQRRL